MFDKLQFVVGFESARIRKPRQTEVCRTFSAGVFMSFTKHCVLLLSLSLLMAAAMPFGVGANTPGQKSDKAQDSKKKKKGRDAVNDNDAQSTPVMIESPPPPPPPLPANGSLFTDAALGSNLFSDFKARGIGDLVFIDVVEESAASVSSNAKRSRDSGTLGGLVGAVEAIPTPSTAIIAGVLNGLGSRKFDGKGETGRTSRLNARVTARVIEVLPNGDLRIEAQKMVKINKEDEMLTLYGIVRRRDVSADNAVPTTMVGDLRVMLNGKGVASADNAPGWLFRLYEKIAPF
jgi:flagellar L-ring protein precursor FlgH